MRKVIEGKRYDTETAEQVASTSYANYTERTYWSEELYRTKKGNWFLYGEGGDLSKYARSAIIPLTRVKAMSWLEVHTTGSEAIENYFADVIDDVWKRGVK